MQAFVKAASSDTECFKSLTARMQMQVLALEDPWIPPDMEIPRRGAVPVRFFGTYNFTWIESQRNLMAFDQGCQDDLPSKCNTKVCSVTLSA